jgi:ATP/maltotriose-dependent transcriptional regulator MalT
MGDRETVVTMRAGMIPMLFLLGRWSEAVARDDDLRDVTASEFALSERIGLVPLLCERGERERAQALLDGIAWARDADQLEVRYYYSAAEARILRARGRPAEALAAARRSLAPGGLPPTSIRVKQCFTEAVEAALALGDLGAAEEHVAWAEALQPGEITPLMRGQTLRFRARVDAETGFHEGVDERFRRAAQIFREQSFTFYLAVTQLEQAEWLAGQGRASEAEPLLADARDTFEHLEARPWSERAGAHISETAALHRS